MSLIGIAFKKAMARPCYWASRRTVERRTSSPTSYRSLVAFIAAGG